MSSCVFKVIIFISLITACLCEGGSLVHRKKHRYHHKHSLFHEFHHLHYLIFLALKVKVILVIGTIWAFALLFGKVFAAIKLTEYMKKSYDHDDHHHHEHEKIVYASSPYGSPYYGNQGIYGKSYDTSAPIAPETVAPDYYNNVQQTYGPPSSGRSSGEDVGIYEHFVQFSRIIRQMNLTEIVFKDMHLDTEECKRKFVCEADFNAKQSFILSTAYEMLSDDSYQKYKTNHTILSSDDCIRLNPNCTEKTEHS